jgi:hypothetical protein
MLKIPRLLWNLKVNFRVYKIPQTDPILSHTDLVNIVTPYLRPILILPSHILRAENAKAQGMMRELGKAGNSAARMHACMHACMIQSAST